MASKPFIIGLLFCTVNCALQGLEVSDWPLLFLEVHFQPIDQIPKEFHDIPEPVVHHGMCPLGLQHRIK